MKTLEENRPSEPGVFSELQNVGADSKGLSPFLAFWRSGTTPAGDCQDDKSNEAKPTKSGGWMMVDVSPARRVKARKSIIERLFSALQTLAIHPPFGLDPVQAHDYWVPHDIADLRKPQDSARQESTETRSNVPPLTPRRISHIRISRRSRSRVVVARRDN